MQQRGMMTMAFFVVASEERRKDFLMKAAVIHALGQPPRFEDFPEPTAGEGEVGVNVRAAGLHPFVRAQASGSQSGSPNVLPQIPGIDGVGSLDDGTRVYFFDMRKDSPAYGMPVLVVATDPMGREQEYYLFEKIRRPANLTDAHFDPARLGKK